VSVRVVIADDQHLVRAGFRMILASEPEIEVVGEASNGIEAVAIAAELRPDVMLMDIRMPELDGIEATRRILAADGELETQVLILTTFDLDEYVYDALRAGASGFLLKDVPPAELLTAIRAVHSGDAVVAPSTTRRLLDRFAPMLPATDAPPPPSLAGLTDREREVLILIAQGLSNAEIAGRLVLSEATVKTHVGRILMKLELRDRVQAVVLAYETGLVRPAR
jgi:DNA-binding NarL/FixJ family response regulator